jgi:hypothetical protein
MSRRVILVLLAVLSLAPVSAAALDITFIKASTTALEDPHGLKLSPGGKYLVVADVGNNCIVALDPHTRGLIAGFGSDHQCGIPDTRSSSFFVLTDFERREHKKNQWDSS